MTRKGPVTKTTVVVAIIAFAAGCLLCLLLTRDDRPKSVADHWHVVEAYREYVTNSANYEAVPATPGLVQLNSEAMPDYVPSLAFLVREGELEHVDLVLPAVRACRETNRYWMKWAQGNQDVFEATGNSSYTDYRPSGEPPLHLNLWFRPRARESVQKLIKDLEDLSAALVPDTSIDG